jgi:GT2 family glycosyltransferase
MMASVVVPVPRVAVIVLNYNGLADTLKCLESLRLLDDACRVILVDNASEVDPRPEAERVLPGLETIRTERNLGYAGGNNRGMAYALDRGAEFLLVLNNDTVVSPRLVASLVAAFDTDSSLGIAGPVVNAMDEPDQIMTYAATFNRGPATEFFTRVLVPLDLDPPAVVPVEIVNGCCMMIRSEVVRRVGMFDEDLFIVHEESDLCLRAMRAGFGCGLVGRTSLVWHKGSSAFDRAGRQVQRYFDTRNLFHILRRHSRHIDGSRRLFVSFRAALTYAYHRFTIEEEAGKALAAKAVVDGVYDALLGRFGPYLSRPRPGAQVIAGTFRFVHRLAMR